MLISITLDSLRGLSHLSLYKRIGEGRKFAGFPVLAGHPYMIICLPMGSRSL